MSLHNLRPLRMIASSLALLCVVPTLMIAFLGANTSATREARRRSPLLSIAVNNGRPLGKAVHEIAERHGWVVTYEDPRIDFAGDTQDVTSSVARSPVPPGRRILVPRGGPFNFSYEPDERGNVDARTTLQALIEAYSFTGYPGTFRLAESSGALHVLPVSARDSTGRIVPQRSLLDTRISLPDRDRDGVEWMEDVRSAVLQATGTRFLLLSFPTNALLQGHFRGPAIDEPARDVLMRALTEATRRKVTWHFLYAPDTKEYAFNIFLIGH